MTKFDHENCPVARTWDLIGRRWTALILRELFVFTSRRNQDFQERLEGISPNTLSERLKRLEAAGIIERQNYQKHPPRDRYLLTSKGRDLGPILLAMKDWGEKHG